MKVSLGWREYAPPAGNDEVKVEIRPLDTAYLMDAISTYGEIQVEKEAALAKIEGDAAMDKANRGRINMLGVSRIQKLAGTCFVDHARNLTGLDEEDGTPVTLAQVASAAPLAFIAAEIMNELIGISRLSEEEEGN